MTPASTLEQWVLLAAVVDHGGYAPAAAAMHRSQSAVSYQIARLQEALGSELLHIVGRRAELTTQGATLLNRARTLLKEFQSLEQLAKSLASGWEAELRLTVDAAYPRATLLRILAELQHSCPNTQIQLADVVLSGAEEAISTGSADLVITSRVPSGFLGERLMQVDFVACAHHDHALFRLGRELRPEDLSQHVQAVLRDSGSQPRDEGWLGSPHRFTVSSMDASLATLLAGLAYAWLPSHVIEPHLASGTLKRLPLVAGATRPVPLFLVLVRPDAAGPAAQAARLSFMQ
jgi:DNA-binding transcriptional LysR family regulator